MTMARRLRCPRAGPGFPDPSPTAQEMHLGGRHARSAGWHSAFPTWPPATHGRVRHSSRFLDEPLYQFQLGRVGRLYLPGSVHGLHVVPYPCDPRPCLTPSRQRWATDPTATGWTDSCRTEFVPTRERCLTQAHHTSSGVNKQEPIRKLTRRRKRDATCFW